MRYRGFIHTPRTVALLPTQQEPLALAHGQNEIMEKVFMTYEFKLACQFGKWGVYFSESAARI